MNKQYRHGVLGGTFDPFHAGHEKLVDFALSKIANLTIGVSSDEFAKSYMGKNPLHKFDQRKKMVEKYLRKKGCEKRTKIIKLNDIFGNTIVDKNLHAIVVTPDSKNNARLINQSRKKLNFQQLKLIHFKFIKGPDQKKISSSRIRSGEINRLGNPYWELLYKKNFRLPLKLRQTFSQPFGEVYNGNQPDSFFAQKGMLITVGDETTKTFNKAKIYPSLAVVDFKINRKTQVRKFSDLGFPHSPKIKNVTNYPGEINYLLSKSVMNFMRHKNYGLVIKINGEEDLAVLPIALLAPLGTCIFYGIRNLGMVKISVDEKLKELFATLLKEFDSSFSS